MPFKVPVSGILVFLVASAAALAQSQATPPAAAPLGYGTDMHIIPKNGQTQDQLWNDRYACHSWAKGQSGFDPMQPAHTPANEAAARREQYREAIVACLQNRGYEVRFGAPPPATPPRPAPPPLQTVSHSNGFKYHPVMVEFAAGYTFVAEDTRATLQDGPIGSFAIDWFPTAHLPLAFRFEGSYARFNATLNARNLASIASGTNVTDGHTNLYGGSIDARLDLAHRSSQFEMYLFGGFGRYRTQTVFNQVTSGQGSDCFIFFCQPGTVALESTVQQGTSEWTKSWNAGFGMEWALSDPLRFFIEGRYMRLAPFDQRNTFIPVQIGLRF